MNELQKKVVKKVEECYELAAEVYGRTFQFPEILFKKRGRVAGTAQSFYGRSGVLNFNMKLLEQNEADFLENTVPHEVAHLVTFDLHGTIRNQNGRRSSHGPEWKAVMRSLGVNPSTTHNYDVSDAGGHHKTKHVYQCGCGKQYAIGPTIHRNIQNGQVRFHNRTCLRVHGPIKYVATAGQVSRQEAKQMVSKKVEAPVQKPVVKPDPIRKGRKSPTRMSIARAMAAKAGVDSRTFRKALCEVNGCNDHAARGVWSSLIREGLVVNGLTVGK